MQRHWTDSNMHFQAEYRLLGWGALAQPKTVFPQPNRLENKNKSLGISNSVFFAVLTKHLSCFDQIWLFLFIKFWHPSLPLKLQVSSATCEPGSEIGLPEPLVSWGLQAPDQAAALYFVVRSDMTNWERSQLLWWERSYIVGACAHGGVLAW